MKTKEMVTHKLSETQLKCQKAHAEGQDKLAMRKEETGAFIQQGGAAQVQRIRQVRGGNDMSKTN